MPSVLIAGCTVNSALLLFVTVILLIVCADSLAGPDAILANNEATVCAPALAATLMEYMFSGVEV